MTSSHVADIIPNSAVASLLDEIRGMSPDFSSSYYDLQEGDVLLNEGKRVPDIVGQITAKLDEFRDIRKTHKLNPYHFRLYGLSISVLEMMLCLETIALVDEEFHAKGPKVLKDGRLALCCKRD